MLPEIDRLPRLDIKILRPLFKKAKEILSAPENRGKSGLSIATSLSYQEKPISLTYYPQKLRIVLKWTSREGKKLGQNIDLCEVESNLGLSPFLLFVCPVTGEPCRKLYTDYRLLGWTGRKAFKHTYSARNDAKSLRIYSQAGKSSRKVEQLQGKKYRKCFYRGQPTKTCITELREINKANRLWGAVAAQERAIEAENERLFRLYEKQERKREEEAE